MTAQTRTVTGISTVAVPVTGQAAAQRLYPQLGFTTVFDVELRPGFRWIDMAAPDGGARPP